VGWGGDGSSRPNDVTHLVSLLGPLTGSISGRGGRAPYQRGNKRQRGKVRRPLFTGAISGRGWGRAGGAPFHRGNKWQRGKSRSPLFTGVTSGRRGREGAPFHRGNMWQRKKIRSIVSVHRGNMWQRGKTRSPFSQGNKRQGGREGTLFTGAISDRRSPF
jgi:hypothetical protein